MNCLEVKNLSYFYNQENPILEDISFSLQKGEVMAILGSNGCGKTTLINLIAGFLKPKAGNISYYNKKEFFSAVVFQDLALFDWKTAFGNIEVSLLSLIKDDSERKTIVKKYLDFLNIQNHAHKLPKELSGGLKQRVAIARALAPNPELLLLDEPFSALDFSSKATLKHDLLDIIQKENKSVIIITHDIEEAVQFSDKILLITLEGYELFETNKFKQENEELKSLLQERLGGIKNDK